MQWLHGVGSIGTCLVPPLIYAMLQRSEVVGTEFHDGRVAGHTYVVDKYAKLPHAKPMHALKFRHNFIEHLWVFGIGESLAWVYSPNEVHLGVVGYLCDVAHHVLVKVAYALLLGTDAGGVGGTPVA